MLGILLGVILLVIFEQSQKPPAFWDILLKALKVQALNGRCYGEYGGSRVPVACGHRYFRGRN